MQFNLAKSLISSCLFVTSLMSFPVYSSNLFVKSDNVIKPKDIKAFDFFARKLAIYNNTIVMGSDSGNGAAYVFELSKQGQWLEKQKLVSYDTPYIINYGNDALA